MKPDPVHEASLRQLMSAPADEIKHRIAIESFKDPDFVATEVLVSLVRARFGRKTGLLDRIAVVLRARMIRLIGAYLRKNPQLSNLVQESSETLDEMTSAAWLTLLADQNPVSFAEVRFLKWIEARVRDYLGERLAQKNRMPSYDARKTRDSDGQEIGREQLLAADEDDGPDAVVLRLELGTKLNHVLMSLEPEIRRAVYYRLELDLDWDVVADLLGVSKPTARKYYKIGLEKLQGSAND